MLNRIWLVIASCLLAQIAMAAPDQSPEQVSSPSFAVTTEEGDLKIYSPKTSFPGKWEIQNDVVTATVEPVGDNQWELSLTARQPIKNVTFPWQVEPLTLGDSSEDDIVLLPLWAGIAITADSVAEWHWTGYEYPGLAFSPLAVHMDPQTALTLAATNWPPRPATPMYAGGRMIMRFSETLKSGEKQTFRVMLMKSPSWHDGAEAYRVWLNRNLTEAGLLPLIYPDKLKRLNGWLDVQLENMTEFKPERIQTLVSRWGKEFQRVQCWGQMSNYTGPAELAKPPIQPGEKLGCCVDEISLHPRYKELPALAKQLEQQGITVGYYIRPRAENGKYLFLDSQKTSADGQTSLQFLLAWLHEAQTKWGGSGIYLDVFSCVRVADDLLFGPRLLKESFPADTVVEGVNDLDPTAFLISGFISGGQGEGGPGKTIKRLGRDFNKVTYPNFSRFVLGDRIWFAGQANSDWKSWGAKNSHWTERQAFLLGAKLDVMNPYEDSAHPEVMNVAIAQMLKEWKRVNWWDREPVYRDTEFLTEIPADVDARRFVDKGGKELIVVDNPQQLKGQTLKCRDRSLPIPPSPLSIIRVP